jgi:hypothetical protein
MKFVEKSFTLLPPAPGVCRECAVDHKPDAPHDAQSLYYQTKFHMQHGRGATWADAVAHCEPAVRQAWETALRERGAWTEPAADGGGSWPGAAPVSSAPSLPRSGKDSRLTMWTLYHSPADHHGLYVVRRWVIPQAGGDPVPDPEPVYFGADLHAARAAIPGEAAACIHRSPSDDPAIVETWF